MRCFIQKIIDIWMIYYLMLRFEGPALKREKDFANSAKRVLAFRRLWLFLLTAALVAVGLMSAFGSRFF